MLRAGRPLALARGIRLRHDRVRDRWVLLGPERGYVLNERGRLVVQALVEGAAIDDDALPFIEQLVEKKLVVKR
jgi:pyrroloquinoline quinone biosynthesis protein D